MFELIALGIFVSHLVALARSRGRSALWCLGGVVVWLMGSAIGWALFPHEGVLATLAGLPVSLVGALIYYRLLHGLDATEVTLQLGRGDNFPCPCCASLQTEDRSGHLVCNACHRGFGWS
ncbi:MAG: hypothetical protein AAF799_31300 [Myxococcota bacterium]